MSAQENSPKNKEIIQENTGLWSFAEYTVPSGAWNALTGRPTVQRFPAGGVPLHSMVTDKLCPTSRAEPPLLERSTVHGTAVLPASFHGLHKEICNSVKVRVEHT